MSRLAGMLSLALFSLPGVVHACPMCFNGSDKNSSAFLYGSLMLMIVPTVTIGSLLYWAYRRYRANEQPPEPPPAPTMPITPDAPRPALHVIRDR
ncbi:MAG TPA: hypothetical protein VJV78_05800 [Polyangiales bacterium]|nr:hypothetical protein [Polyangiales bacterium]